MDKARFGAEISKSCKLAANTLLLRGSITVSGLWFDWIGIYQTISVFVCSSVRIKTRKIGYPYTDTCPSVESSLQYHVKGEKPYSAFVYTA